MPETVDETVSSEAVDVENRPRTRLLGDLSGIQIAGGALAAVTSALAASRLGVAGTLIGAGVGSVVASVAGTLYSNSIRIHAEKLAGLRRRTTDSTTGMVSVGIEPKPSPVRGPGRRWGRILAPIALVALLGIGVVTSIEAVLGHPFGDSTGTGTSVSAVVRDSGTSNGSGSDGSGSEGSGSEGSGSDGSTSTDPSSTMPEDGATPSADPNSGPTAEPTGQPSSGSSTTPSSAPSEDPSSSSPTEPGTEPSAGATAEPSASAESAPDDPATSAPRASGSDPQ